MTTFDSSTASKSFVGPKYKINITKSFATPGNSSASKYTVVALVEGRGNARGEIGLASMDVRYSEVNICQLMDTPSYSLLKVRLQLLDPVEVLVPEPTSEKSNNMNVLLELIKSSCKTVQLTTVHRRYFNEGRGAEMIKQLAVPECSNIDADVLKKYYCVASFAALIQYVEYIQNTLFAQNSLKIMYENIENSCMIDINTLRNLEVVGAGSKYENDSLYSVLKNCLTGGGDRTLRSNILQPSANLDSINTKLDCVEELANNQSMLERLRAILSYMYDLGAVITVCVHLSRGDNVRNAKQTVQQIINLQKTLQMMESLRKVLAVSKSKLFLSYATHLKDPRLKKIHDLVNTKLDLSVFSRNDRRGSLAMKEQMLMAVRSGLEVLLDVPRRAYEELVVDVQQQGVEEAKSVPGASLIYSIQKGFHMAVSTRNPYALKLPSNIIQVVRNRCSVTFTTRALIQYNDRIQQFENEILLQSGVVVDGLLTEIRTLLPSLYHCIEIISMCDYLASLALYASKTPTVRPMFSSSMVIKQGRHPVLEQSCDVTSNDTYISDESRFIMITGPNMAGKSTYLKQVCLLQILAQMGSMVPAEFASFKPITRIYSRVGHNDDLNANLSAFALEMSEMNVITQFSDSNSLIVIDELARSTSTEEGIGISYAICERLLMNQAFVLCATHFLDLGLMDMNYPAVQNFHFSVNTTKDSEGHEVLEATHQMCKGTYKGPLYGLELAELTTFPTAIVEKARVLAQNLRASAEQRHNMTESEVDIRVLSQLGHKLAGIFPRANDVDPAQLAAYLKQLRVAYKKDALCE